MFKNYEELTKALSQEQIVNVVNRFLADRRKRNTYHKNYNERRKMLAARMVQLEALANKKGVNVEDLLDLEDE